MSHGGLLVPIDLQEVFADPQSPWAVPGFGDVVEPVERLVAAYGPRVRFTRFVVPPAPDGSWGHYYRRWSFVTEPEAAPLLELSAPWASPGLETLDRPRFSKWGAQLEAEAGAARTLVLCGVATDCCVIATALAAVDSGAHVRVVADACAGASAAAHHRALALMEAFAPQLELTSVEEELGRLAPGPVS